MAADDLAHGRSADRGGFALFAVIIIVAVFTVLATVITVNLTGDNDAKRIAKVADVLKRLEIEIDSTTPAFRAQVGRYPGALSQLSIQITTTHRDSCNATYTSAVAGNWRGPYHIFPMSAGSYVLGPGFIANDALARSTPTTSVGFLPIVIPNVTRSDARMLGIAIDGVDNGLGKYVSFPATGDPVTVQYKNPIGTGC